MNRELKARLQFIVRLQNDNYRLRETASGLEKDLKDSEKIVHLVEHRYSALADNLAYLCEEHKKEINGLQEQMSNLAVRIVYFEEDVLGGSSNRDKVSKILQRSKMLADENTDLRNKVVFVKKHYIILRLHIENWKEYGLLSEIFISSLLRLLDSRDIPVTGVSKRAVPIHHTFIKSEDDILEY